MKVNVSAWSWLQTEKTDVWWRLVLVALCPSTPGPRQQTTAADIWDHRHRLGQVCVGLGPTSALWGPVISPQMFSTLLLLAGSALPCLAGTGAGRVLTTTPGSPHPFPQSIIEGLPPCPELTLPGGGTPLLSLDRCLPAAELIPRTASDFSY